MINIKRLFFILAFFACFFTSEACNAQKINQLDSSGKRTGVWIKYHPNKRIRYKGTFENGKEVGVFKFYDIVDSKYPIIIKKFSRNSESVRAQFFTINGKLQTEGAFIGRDRVGNWKYFRPDGKLVTEENYKNGKLHGEQITYYPDGQVTEFSIYKNGLKHGTASKYSSKGILIEEIEYKNDQPNGIAKYFELNGVLKETGTYKNGNRIGEWEFYLDGEIATDEEKKKKNKFKKKNK